MKKFLFLIFSFFILPICALAVDNVDYDVSNYYIKANITTSGDLKVKELIVLDGSFNGYERTINYGNDSLRGYTDVNFEHSEIYNPSSISDVKISAKYMDGKVKYSDIDDTDFEEFSSADYAYKGDKHKYTKTEKYNGDTYRMYYESRHKKVGFLIEYTLDDFVVMHDDVAELYWQIITADSENDDYDNFEVRVYLPREDDSDYFRVWAHGPLYGEVDKSSNNDYLVATIDTLESGTDLDVRLTFNKDLIFNDFSLNHTYVDGFDEIIDVETTRADDANAIREKLKKTYRRCDIFSKIMLFINAAGIFTIMFKYGIKPKTDFYAKYYREFIEDYSVEVIDYLYNKKITPKALSAGIMNLVYKKVCKVEEILDTKNTKKKNYKFILENREGLSEADEKLVSFLFDTVGNGKEFTTKGLKSYASSLSTGSKFQRNYRNWEQTIKKDGVKQGFFKSKTTGGFICAGIAVLTFINMIHCMSVGADTPFSIFAFLLMIVFVIYTCSVKAYSKNGALHLKKWNAFKNFLNDFGTFDTKELPEIALWERYLVYATVFGLAKKLQKDIEVKIKEMGIDDPTITTTYTRLYLYDSISRSFSNAVTDGQRAYAASRANAYSSSSSGGGFGGGFSSGGGFGGGGGGGHGF